MPTPSSQEPPATIIGGLLRLASLALACYAAVSIRLFSVENYGRVIHEFDPWFNFRATEYMVEHGWDKFQVSATGLPPTAHQLPTHAFASPWQAWYDEKAWYPLGRHVGSTTYPGLQLTSWLIFNIVNRFTEMSLNDVCVFIPAGFGAVAT